MTAPPMCCVEHPHGSPKACAGCDAARQAYAAWVVADLRSQLTSVGGMTAPSTFCKEHPRGSVDACGPCRDKRLTSEALGAEEYVRRTDDGKWSTGRHPQLDAVTAHEVEADTSGLTVRVDVANHLVDVTYPGPVGSLRVEVENGSVVVHLNAHGAEPTEAS